MEDGVSTSMDQLIELIEKRGTIKMADASRELSADKERIESWAKMLEKAGMVEIHYSVIGGALLKKGPRFAYATKRSHGALPAVKAEAAAPKVNEPEVEEPPAGDLQQEYALIRMKIEEEETILERDLKKLYEEQAIIAQYMSGLITEGKKLSEYIETLRQLVERSKSDRDKPLTA